MISFDTQLKTAVCGLNVFTNLRSCSMTSTFVVLFILWNRVALSVESVDETLECVRLNESYLIFC